MCLFKTISRPFRVLNTNAAEYEHRKRNISQTADELCLIHRKRQRIYALPFSFYLKTAVAAAAKKSLIFFMVML